MDQHHTTPQPLLQSWRWFGPNDPVTLDDVRQAGATGIVSALHHLPNGAVWTLEDIQQRKAAIEAAGLRWSVIESIPVHEDIKRRSGQYRSWIEHYKTSLRNAAACGIPVVCYNFMPVLDWTRTDLAWRLPNGAEALRFDMAQLAAFDVYLLQRPGAAESYTEAVLRSARDWFAQATEPERARLARNIIAGLPGSEESYTVETFRQHLAAYAGIGAAALREHLFEFLREIAPVAEETGIRLAIHPDDPPFDMFGLPRVVSTAADAEAVIAVHDVPENGICFCTGSFGARADNRLPAMMEQLGRRVNFLHFRSVQLEPDGSFFEADHLGGSAQMAEVMQATLREQARRVREGRSDTAIPMRPDHGHRMLGDLHEGRKTNPGYTLYGRMRGLAELRGLELGLRTAMGWTGV